MSVYLIVEAADETAASGLVYEKYRIPLSLYPDNSPVLNMGSGGLVQIPQLMTSRFIEGLLVNYTTYMDFVSAMDFAFTMNQHRYGLKTLYLPYLPGARQDKPRDLVSEKENTGDVLMTLDFTARMIRNAGFNEVVVLDIHSEKAVSILKNQGLLVREVNPIPDLDYSKYDGVISPDAGAVDRAVAVAQQNNLPVFFGQKHRDPQTNKLSGFSVSKLPTHAHYLVIDDICDGGGTFIGLAEEIAKERAKADLFVTHGLFTHGAAERLKRVYNEVFTTDSLGYSADGVTVVPTVNRMFYLPLRELYITQGER